MQKISVLTLAYIAWIHGFIIQVLWLFPRFVIRADDCNLSLKTTIYYTTIVAVIFHFATIACFCIYCIWMHWTSKHILDNIALPTNTNANANTDDCAICISSKIEPYELIACKHSYCKKCLISTLLYTKTCPLCRNSIIQDQTQLYIQNPWFRYLPFIYRMNINRSISKNLHYHISDFPEKND
jgi:hypothetical protein